MNATRSPRRRLRSACVAITALLTAALETSPARAQAAAATTDVDWPTYGGSSEASNYSPLSDINIGSLNPALREASLNEVLLAIGCCRRMDIDLITVHPGFISPLGQLDRGSVMNETRRSIVALDRAGAENGVVVALENMPRMPITTCTEPNELLSLLEGTSLGICFDIGHAHTNGNIDDFVKHRSRFANVHIHDNDGSSDQHLTIGEGRIDFERVLARMSGYQHRYVIEARKIEGAPLSQARLKKLLDL